MAGFPGPAVLSAVTATELTIRYFILRPILEGAFLSEEWTGILVGRILCPRAVSDRELLAAVLHAWNIDLTTRRVASGKLLWSSFVKEVLPLFQRQLEKVRVAANEWVLFWLRLVLRVSLAWRSFWSRAAKMASSLPASLSAGVM